MPRSSSEQPDTSNLKPVGTVVPPVGAPALPAYPPAPNPYLRTPLPAGQQLQPDTLRQFYQKGFPQTRIVPLPTTAQATINAAAGGIAKSVSTAAIQNIDIGLLMPPQYAVSGSPAGAQGSFVVQWLNEPSNFFLAGPSGISVYSDAVKTGTGFSATVSVAATAVHANDFALVFTVLDNLIGSSYTPGASWTNFYTAGGYQFGYSKTLSGAGTVTASSAISPSQTWSSLLILFNSTGSASIPHQVGLNSGAFSSGSNVIPPTTAGNMLLVVMLSGGANALGGVRTIT